MRGHSSATKTRATGFVMPDVGGTRFTRDMMEVFSMQGYKIAGRRNAPPGLE